MEPQNDHLALGWCRDSHKWQKTLRESCDCLGPELRPATWWEKSGAMRTLVWQTVKPTSHETFSSFFTQPGHVAISPSSGKEQLLMWAFPLPNQSENLREVSMSSKSVLTVTSMACGTRSLQGAECSTVTRWRTGQASRSRICEEALCSRLSYLKHLPMDAWSLRLFLSDRQFSISFLFLQSNWSFFTFL